MKYNLQRTHFSIFVENKTLLNLLIQENLISQQNFALFSSEPIKMKYLTSGLLTLFFRISLLLSSEQVKMKLFSYELPIFYYFFQTAQTFSQSEWAI